MNDDANCARRSRIGGGPWTRFWKHAGGHRRRGAYSESRRQIVDPTSMVVVDEADRLRMTSLEQMRATFDDGDIGLGLLGMPGSERRLARYTSCTHG
jgi:DNA transposition AAA+ family ATPase